MKYLFYVFLFSLNCHSQTVTLGCIAGDSNLCSYGHKETDTRQYQAKGVICNDVCENFTINYKTMSECKQASEEAVKNNRDYKYVCFKKVN